VNLSKEHFIPTQELTFIVSLKNTKKKGRKKRNRTEKQIIYFSKPK
jgi:hypothetical protein